MGRSQGLYFIFFEKDVEYGECGFVLSVFFVVMVMLMLFFFEERAEFFQDVFQLMFGLC